MSRCIPFPPPEYVWSGVKGETLIELIKVRREKAEVKRRKKEEKKDKRRRKMEEGEIKKKRHSHHGRHTQCLSEDCNERTDYQAKKENEMHGMVRNSPPEELKQPIIADSLSDSFNTSHSAMKRIPERCHNHGRVVLIDIRLQEHKNQDLLFDKPMCSITAMDFVVPEKSELSRNYTKQQFSSSHRDSKSIMEQFVPNCGESTTTALKLDRPDIELCHPCPQAEVVRDGEAELALISQYSRIGFQDTELNFQELVVNWIPFPMKIEHPDFENLVWLYETKPERLPRSTYTENSSTSNEKLSNPVSSLYPTAQFMAEAGLYALPFTIPF